MRAGQFLGVNLDTTYPLLLPLHHTLIPSTPPLPARQASHVSSPNLIERCVGLHERVGVRASDIDADHLPRQDVARGVETPYVRVSRGREPPIWSLRNKPHRAWLTCQKHELKPSLERLLNVPVRSGSWV